MSRLLSAFVAALLAIAAPASTQGLPPVPVPHEQTVSANPFGLLFGWFNAEYERKLTPATTWGVSGSMLDVDTFEYRTANALLRYYPQAEVVARINRSISSALKGVGLTTTRVRIQPTRAR